MKFVAYYRVSTKQQGAGGLGIDSQRSIVAGYIKDGVLLAEFTEVESGKKNQRKELQAALSLCKKESATLVIAKLDRLSRNVAFLAILMESGLEFICCDMPNANKFTLHIFSALAEQERELISTRTKAALKELKAKGIKLGKPENLNQAARVKGNQARRDQAVTCDVNRVATKIIVSERREGKTFEAIVAELNSLGLKTTRGNSFSLSTVHSLLKRA